MARAPEILSRDREHVVALYGDLLIQMWLGSVPLEAAKVVAAAGRKLAEAGRPFRTLIVVGPTAAPPQAPSRAVLLEFGQDCAPHLKSAVLVAEPTGLKGAIMRAIMTGMGMMVQSIHVVIAARVEEGVTALRAEGVSVEAGELEGVLAELRRTAGPAAPAVRTTSPLRSPT
jgi:hypothetical protein